MLDSLWFTPAMVVIAGTAGTIIVIFVVMYIEGRLQARIEKNRLLTFPAPDATLLQKIETDINMGQLERNIKLLQRGRDA